MEWRTNSVHEHGYYWIIFCCQNFTKLQMLTCTQKFYSTKEYSKAWEQGIEPEYIAITCGSTENSFDLVRRKVATNKNLKMICIDVANGYREIFLEFVKRVREEFPAKIIIAGNVATREMTEVLILAGADIVKVGIGPGSVCTTRKVAGVGYPQLSAISECADAAHGLLGTLWLMEGARPQGMLQRHLPGADFVMLGGMFAGHDESGGEIVEGRNGKMYKSFYGMSSAKLWKLIMEKLPSTEPLRVKKCESHTEARWKILFNQY